MMHTVQWQQHQQQQLQYQQQQTDAGYVSSGPYNPSPPPIQIQHQPPMHQQIPHHMAQSSQQQEQYEGEYEGQT